MAVGKAADLLPVTEALTRLQALLARASEVKRSTSIEPVLPTLELLDGIDALRNGIGGEDDQQLRWNALETAARRIFYNRLSSTQIGEPGFVEVWNLLDILIVAGDRGLCESPLPCHLLEELLDSQTTDGCRKVFDYLDSRRERVAHKDFHKKNLIFLRACNELLRRLSRAEDAVFCGRVFFFLFQTFPLGDKSSVNLRGDFHTENTTKFEDILPGDGEAMEIDPVQDKADEAAERTTASQFNSKTGIRIAGRASEARKMTQKEELLDNHALYPIFWRLQRSFCEPTRLFATDNLDTFKKGLAYTFTKFKKTPVVVSTRITDDLTLLGHDAAGDQISGNYNPKYLTSPDLFDLELSDLAFQRHILLQGIILIDFLLSLTDKAKKKMSTVSPINRSLLYDYTFSDEDTKWAEGMRSSLRDYLNKTDLQGRFYCRLVDTVLARDKNWVRWKLESCPSIVRDPAPTEEELGARKGSRHATFQRHLPDQPPGAMDLSFLQEDPGFSMDSLRNPNRYTEPSIEDLLDGIRTDELDKDMAVDDNEITSLDHAMANKRWRGLRLARSKRLGLLDKVEPGKDLESLIKPKFAREDVGMASEKTSDVTSGRLNGEAPLEGQVQGMSEPGVE